MRSVLVPRIEIFKEEQNGEWHWRILHPQSEKVIGASIEGNPSKEDCLLQLKMLGRLITGWAVAEEANFALHNNEEKIMQS